MNIYTPSNAVSGCPPATGGGSDPGYRSLSLLKAGLASAPNGSSDFVKGPGGEFIGRWFKVSSGVFILVGRLNLAPCDGTEFTVGVNGSGSDIEYVGSAPTWDNGLVVNGSKIYFRCAGSYSGAGAMDCYLRVTPTTLTVNGSPHVTAGVLFNSDANGHGGGVRWLTSAWYRCQDDVNVSISGTTSGRQCSFVQGTPTILGRGALAGNPASNNGTGLSGAYTTTGEGNSQPYFSISGLSASGHNDLCIYLDVNASSGSIVLAVDEINVLSALP